MFGGQLRLRVTLKS